MKCTMQLGLHAEVIQRAPMLCNIPSSSLCTVCTVDHAFNQLLTGLISLHLGFDGETLLGMLPNMHQLLNHTFLPQSWQLQLDLG